MKLAWDSAHRVDKHDGSYHRIIREGQCVDHIIPWPVCSDFFDESNLQTLCNQCNMEKGIKDRPLITKWKREHGEWTKNL